MTFMHRSSTQTEWRQVLSSYMQCCVPSHTAYCTDLSHLTCLKQNYHSGI